MRFHPNLSSHIPFFHFHFEKRKELKTLEPLFPLPSHFFFLFCGLSHFPFLISPKPIFSLFSMILKIRPDRSVRVPIWSGLVRSGVLDRKVIDRNRIGWTSGSTNELNEPSSSIFFSSQHPYGCSHCCRPLERHPTGSTLGNTPPETLQSPIVEKPCCRPLNPLTQPPFPRVTLPSPTSKLPHPPSSPFPKSPLSKNPVVDHSTPHTRCTLEPSCKIPLSPLFTSPKIPVAQKPRRWPLKPMCPQAQLQNFPILSLLLSQNPLVLTIFFF